MHSSALSMNHGGHAVAAPLSKASNPNRKQPGPHHETALSRTFSVALCFATAVLAIPAILFSVVYLMFRGTQKAVKHLAASIRGNQAGEEVDSVKELEFPAMWR